MSQIQVKAPDGSIVQFPAGTDDATIERVMSENYGQEKPGLLSRAGTAIANAWRGDAAEPEAKTAYDSPEFVQAQRAFRESSGVLGSLGQAFKQLSASTLGSDEDLAKALAATVPGSSVVADANGNPMIRLPSGERVYANRPGMDTSDPLKFAGNIAAYLPAARAGRAIGGSSTLARAGVTGILSGATNAGGQVAAGRDEVDANEVAITTGLGAAGEVVAPLVGKVWQTASGLFQRGATKTQAALAAARAVGVESPSNAQIQSLSNALDEIRNGADPESVLQRDEFKFIFTTGQKMAANDPRRAAQLTREEFWRQQAADPNSPSIFSQPATIMAQVDNHNTKALGNFLDSRTGGLSPSQQFEQVQGALQAQRQAAKEGVDAAYAAVRDGGNSFVGLDGLRQMPQRLRAAIRDFRIDPQNFPATSRALQGIEDDLARLSGGRVSAVSLDAIEAQRRVLNNQIGAAANRADRAALTTLKREFDNAVDDAWESSLRSGDQAQLEALKNARAARAEFARRFEPEGAAGALIENLSLGNITPDEAVAKVIGVTQVAAPKAIPYIRAIKAAAKDDPTVVQQLQAAHFANLLQDSAGNLLPPGRIAANIQRAERNTGTLIRELYTPDQWAQMLRLADATSRLAIRGPDTNVTGGGRGLRGLQQIIQGNAWLGTVARLPGVQWAVNAVQQGAAAAQATSAARGVIPSAAPSVVVPAAAATQGGNLSSAMRTAPRQ